MNEIYWITRLDALSTLFMVTATISGIITFIATMFYFFTVGDTTMEKENKTESRIVKITFPTLVISVLLIIFTPTTKDAFTIWGVGGTIDYIKSNDTAKQLPDKCIKALDKFVDEYMLNENKEN